MLAIFLLAFVTSVTEIQGVQIDFYNDCGRFMNCLGIGSESSCVERRNCQYLIAVKYDRVREDLETVFHSIDLNYFVAIGISNDRSMGNDDVIAVVVDPQTRVPLFLATRTQGNSGVANETVLATNTQPEVTVDSGGFVVRATFNRIDFPASFLFTNFDRGTSHYLLLAAGGPIGVGAPPHLIFHNGGRVAALNSADLALVHRLVSGAAEYLEHKIHAVAMIWTWMFIIPLGIVIARYYKQTWVHIRFCRRRVWLTLHVAILMFGLITGLSGYFAIIYKNTGIFSNPTNSFRLPIHQAMGFTAIVLLITQSYTNWCRVDDPLRQTVLSGAHALMGVACYLLGIYNIILAETFVGEELFRLPSNLQYLPLASFILLLLVFFVLSSYLSWTDSHMGVRISRAFFSYPLEVSSPEEAPRPKLRKRILYGFIVFTFIFCLTYTLLLLLL